MKSPINIISKLLRRLMCVPFIIWLFPNNFVKAQSIALTPKPQPWTLGVILVQESNPYSYYQFEPDYLKGLLLKRNYEEISLRLALEYTSKNIPENQPTCCDQQSISGNFMEGTARIGLEKEFFANKYLRPYLTLDLFASNYNSDFNFNGGFFPTQRRVKTSILGVGCMPTLGLEFTFSKHISIAIETRAKIAYNILDQDVIDIGRPQNSHKNSDQFFSETFNRLSGLNLNIHF